MCRENVKKKKKGRWEKGDGEEVNKQMRKKRVDKESEDEKRKMTGIKEKEKCIKNGEQVKYEVTHE